MTKKKLFILLGHSDRSGVCGKLADAYEQGARDAGHDVQRLNIGEMQFDPILHLGYLVIQELEPDLKKFQELVKWSDHFVIVHPVWWLGMPAILKGLFDRAWLPGSAFRYIKKKDGKNTIFFHRLYKGKTARLIVTSGNSPLLERLFPGKVNSQLKWGLLWFAGFSTRSVWYGPTEDVSDAKLNAWCEQVRTLGQRAI